MAKCTHCGSDGKHHPQGTRGNKHRYTCDVCGKYFSIPIGDELPIDEPIDSNVENSYLIRQIINQYSPKELQAIANGGRIMPGLDPVPVVDFSGKRYLIYAQWQSITHNVSV